MMSCAVAVIFLGLTGTVKEMLHIGSDGAVMLVGTNCMLASLIGGAVIGEAINLEDRMECFGRWLQQKTGSGGDTRFFLGFRCGVPPRHTQTDNDASGSPPRVAGRPTLLLVLITGPVPDGLERLWDGPYGIVVRRWE